MEIKLCDTLDEFINQPAFINEEKWANDYLTAMIVAAKKEVKEDKK